MKNEIDFGFADPATHVAYESLATRIARGKVNAGDALYDIGIALLEAKASLEHGLFTQFLRDDRVKYEPRAAQILMNIARAEDGRKLAALGVAKAVQLLRATVAQRARLFIEHDIPSASVAKLRMLVDQLLGKKATFRFARKSRRETPPEVRIAWAAGALHVPLDKLSISAVESAFKALAKILHPDLGLAKDDKFIRELYDARATLIGHCSRAKAA